MGFGSCPGPCPWRSRHSSTKSSASDSCDSSVSVLHCEIRYDVVNLRACEWAAISIHEKSAGVRTSQQNGPMILQIFLQWGHQAMWQDEMDFVRRLRFILAELNLPDLFLRIQRDPLLNPLRYGHIGHRRDLRLE